MPCILTGQVGDPPHNDFLRDILAGYSERQLKRELQLTRGCGSLRQQTGIRQDVATDVENLRLRANRGSEVRMVEDIEGFRAELKVELF